MWMRVTAVKLMEENLCIVLCVCVHARVCEDVL